MFQYAMLRTPGHLKTGKELLRILSEVISEDQPTPQVVTDGEFVSCEWFVDGWNVQLWIEENEDDHWDNEFVYIISDDEFTRGECSGMREDEYYDRTETVASLLPRLERLGRLVDEEHRIIK